MADKGEENKLKNSPVLLKLIKNLSCLETPPSLRSWNTKCSHSIACDDAVPREIDSMSKLSSVIKFCKF